MAREIFMRRSARGPFLEPSGEFAEVALDGLRPGAEVRVRVDRPRKIELHRKYWEICNRIAQMMVAYGHEGETAETVSARLKVASGLCTFQPASAALRRATGVEMIAIPGSIAFHKMDQAAFEAFMGRVEGFVLTQLLPKLPASEWTDRIASMVEAA